MSQSFVLNRHSLSISRCRSRYEADLSVYVVSYISSSIGQIRSTKSPNLELFSERRSSIYRNVQLKDRDSFFSFLLRRPCMKSASYQERNKSARRGPQFAPYVCRLSVKNTSTKHSKYVINQKLEHVDDIRSRELFGRIRVIFFAN